MPTSATLAMPAARAAAIPTGASSTTTQRSAGTPRRSAAISNTCGSGLPRVTSRPVTMARKRSRRPEPLERQLDVLGRPRRADREQEAVGGERVDQLDRAVHGREVGADEVAVDGLLAGVERLACRRRRGRAPRSAR